MSKVTRYREAGSTSTGGTGGGGGGTGTPVSGDLGGTIPAPTVTGIQGVPVCANAPTSAEVLTFDGTQWCPAPLPGGSAVEVLDEGVSLTATPLSIDFVGPGVTATEIAGAVTVTIPGGSGSLPWFNVLDYGAVGDGTTDDTAAVNAAIAALVAAGKGVLYFPAGTYRCTGALTALSVPFLVLGDGSASDDSATAVSLVTCTSATAALFTATADVGRFEKIGLINTAGSTPSAGGGIVVAGASAAQRIDFEGVSVGAFWIDIDIQVGDLWTMHSCFLVGPVKYALKIRNTVAPDNGDWSISNCSFFAQTYSADAAIRIESSGGGKISHVKLNAANGAGAGPKFVRGIDLVGAATSILIVSDSSIENYTGDGIRAAGGWPFQVYSGLQFAQYGNGSGSALNISSTTDVIIDDVVLFADTGTPTAITLTSVTRCALGRFTNSGFATLVSATTSTLLDATGGIGSSVYVTGTPTAGQVPTATGAAAATWQTPSGGSIAFEDLSDVTITSVATGEMPRWNGSAWVNDAGLVCVDPGSIVVDAGAPFGITLTTPWGVDTGVPYYDVAGAAAGEEAALFYDPLIDQYVLIEYLF